MAKSLALVCIFALFASSLAQTITTLTSGVVATGTLLPVATDYDNDRQANYYKIWLPGNTKTVDLTVTNTATTACTYVNWMASGDNAPCNREFSEPTDFSYICRSADYSYSGSSASTRTYVLGDTNSDDLGIKSDAWFYVTIGRDALKTESCAYSVLVTVTTCAAGEIAPYEYYKSGSVSPYAECDTLGNSITTPSFTATLNVTSQYSHHRIWVSRNTAQITFNVVNATEYVYIYGNNNFPASDSYSYCSQTVTGSDETLTCYLPEEGWFYFAFRQYSYSAGDSVAFVLTINSLVCSDDKAGYNCSYPAQNIATLTANQAFSLVASVSGGWQTYPTQYFYLDVANGTLAFYNFTATLTTGSAVLIYRRNAFPAESSNFYRTSNDYETISTGSESFALTWGETIVGGRHYFAVSNSYSAAAAFTASSASASATSAAATTDATTTTTGSGAASIVAPLALIALIVAALL